MNDRAAPSLTSCGPGLKGFDHLFTRVPINLFRHDFVRYTLKTD